MDRFIAERLAAEITSKRTLKSNMDRFIGTKHH